MDSEHNSHSSDANVGRERLNGEKFPNNLVISFQQM